MRSSSRSLRAWAVMYGSPQSPACGCPISARSIVVARGELHHIAARQCLCAIGSSIWRRELRGAVVDPGDVAPDLDLGAEQVPALDVQLARAVAPRLDGRQRERRDRRQIDPGGLAGDLGRRPGQVVRRHPRAGSRCGRRLAGRWLAGLGCDRRRGGDRGRDCEQAHECRALDHDPVMPRVPSRITTGVGWRLGGQNRPDQPSTAWEAPSETAGADRSPCPRSHHHRPTPIDAAPVRPTAIPAGAVR